MNIWPLVLLFSFITIQESFSQTIIPTSTFAKNGGIEVAINPHDLSSQLLEHDGITIDHGTNHDQVILYLTESGYLHLRNSKIEYTYLERKPSKIIMKDYAEITQLKSGGICMPVMDFYPTYEAYEQMMLDFTIDYPELCQLINIGTLDSGRKLWMLNIGDNPGVDELEPNFLYTSTMHGDETAGFPIMLQFIDMLLCNYDDDESIKNLVDNINIFINPLANPDGTYRNDNSTVANAQRRNANQIDLNRNFTDPKEGPNPDNRPTQDETQFFIDFSKEHKIHLACNIHSGEEVVNYPWDTFEHTHADDSWWIETSRAYAESAQNNSPDGYMTALDNGITNGFAWYEVNGGRQDYMTYFERSREFTLEISDQKILDADQLPVIWEANHEALTNYMSEALYGLKGTITDCNTGLPIKAEVIMRDHDVDNSSVFSDSIQGDFYRFLDDGIYEVMVIAENYDTLFETVVISDDDIQEVNWELCKMNVATKDLTDQINLISTGETIEIIDLPAFENIILKIHSTDGRTILSDYDNNNAINVSSLSKDRIYILSVLIDNQIISKSFFNYQ